MNSLKRLCPACGAANALEMELCRVCGAEVKSNLPVPIGERLPVPWKEVGASLAVGAGALALRAGLHLAKHLVERKASSSIQLGARSGVPSQVRRWLSRRGQAEKVPPAQPQIRFWGRRVRGSWRSDGAGQMEVEEVYWQAANTER